MKSNHYAILGLTRSCSEADIVRAYRILAKRYHPDKNKSSEKSHDQFVQIQQAYEVLRDPIKRKRYDVTGDDEDGIVSESLIKAEDIELFTQTYPSSPEERDDVLEFYQRFDGDISELFDFIPASTPTDDCFERLIKYIDEAIESAEISEGIDRFEKSRIRLKKKLPRLRAKLRREKKEHIEEHGEMSFSDLAAKIKANQHKRRQEFDKQLLQLQDRSAEKKKRKTKSKTKGVTNNET